MNASSVAILEHLIRADTASAFNISVGDVNVTGISQVQNHSQIHMKHFKAPISAMLGTAFRLLALADIICILDGCTVNRKSM